MAYNALGVGDGMEIMLYCVIVGEEGNLSYNAFCWWFNIEFSAIYEYDCA